jgi:D-aminopeptidase
MTDTTATRLDRALAALPQAFPGPGGAVAVLRAGEVLARHAWGWANAELRIPFTPGTLVRMCSITKQFTCALALELFPDLSVLDAAIRAYLPNLEGAAPTAAQLAHNQSGLRDYWAVAMLHGSPATAPFGDTEARRVIAGARTTQFTPGTRYSYSNGNFRLLSDVLQERAGRSFAELLTERVLRPAGMARAILAADTRALPDGTEGYEGTPGIGWRPAENRVVWTGDAGLGACLDDMIAWERQIDATRDDRDALYNRLAAPVTFADSTRAEYGYGLGRRTELGVAVTGHGGALRGWRSHRLHAPAERVSVVVMFNHLSDAHEAAVDLLAATLGLPRQLPDATLPPPPWLGAYVDPETGLSARIEAARPGQILLRHGHSPERLDLQPDGSARSGGTRLRLEGGALRMDRAAENRSSALRAAPAGVIPDGVAGRYRCAELDAALTVADPGGVLYGAFSGFLGQSRMELLEPIAADLWALPCPRALDHTPPGDWTLAVRREGGRVVGITVGCWLARGLWYERERCGPSS